MATTNDPRGRPMAEPGKQQSGTDVGGMSKSADAGLSDAAARSQERGAEQPAAPEAGAAATPKRGTPPKAGVPAAQPFDDDEEPWRHPPVAPRDEDPLKSLGRSISEPLIGSTDDPAKPKT